MADFQLQQNPYAGPQQLYGSHTPSLRNQISDYARESFETQFAAQPPSPFLGPQHFQQQPITESQLQMQQRQLELQRQMMEIQRQMAHSPMNLAPQPAPMQMHLQPQGTPDQSQAQSQLATPLRQQPQSAPGSPAGDFQQEGPQTQPQNL